MHRPLRVFTLVMALGCLGCATPEDIVIEAAQAARSGDRDHFVGCFTPRSRPLIRAFWSSTGSTRPELSALSAKAVAVTSVTRLPPGVAMQQRAVVRLSEEGRDLNLVVHELGGTWRIDLVDSEQQRALTALERSF